MVHAECDVAPVQNTTRRTDKQQMQARVRKVTTLARTGEKRRAQAAARTEPPVSVTEPIVQEINGMRAEHWYDFGSLARNSYLFVQVVAHIAAAAVLHSVLQYQKAGQITPLSKPTGGHRPLLMMSFLRRLALKSVMAAK